MRPAGRRSLVVTVAALLAIVLTANLGFWQLRRAAQKVALQTAIDDRAVLPVVGAEELLAAGDEDASGHAAAAGHAAADHGAAAEGKGDAGHALSALHYRRVHLQGRWLADRTVFLDNRQMNARVGFYVVTPLQLAGRPEAVLVQRGWVPRDLRDRQLLPSIVTPAGPVEVDGRIAPPPSRLYEFAPSASGVIRQNLDLAEFSVETGLRLLPVSVQQADPPAPKAGPSIPDTASNDTRLRRDWLRPALNVDMHYGYAFQWFALCGLTAGLCAWFQLIRPRRSGVARRVDVGQPR